MAPALFIGSLQMEDRIVEVSNGWQGYSYWARLLAASVVVVHKLSRFHCELLNGVRPCHHEVPQEGLSWWSLSERQAIQLYNIIISKRSVVHQSASKLNACALLRLKVRRQRLKLLNVARLAAAQRYCGCRFPVCTPVDFELTLYCESNWCKQRSKSGCGRLLTKSTNKTTQTKNRKRKTRSWNRLKTIVVQTALSPSKSLFFGCHDEYRGWLMVN